MFFYFLFSSSVNILVILPFFFFFFFTKFLIFNYYTLALALAALLFGAKLHVFTLFICFYLFVYFFYKVTNIFFLNFLALCALLLIFSPTSFWNFNLTEHVPNNALWDGLAVLHPPAVAIAYASILFYFILNYFNFFKFINFNLFRAVLCRYAIIFFAAALVLGSWWAQQELNWGGWWGWDPIELGLLLLYFASLAAAHFKFLKKKLGVVALFFIFNFLNIKFNYFVSVHNFITEVYVLPNFYFIYLIIYVYMFNSLRCLSSVYFIVCLFSAYQLLNNSLNLKILINFLLYFFALYISLTQRFLFLINPVPIFFSFFLFLNKKQFLHYIVHAFLIIIIFFKLTTFFTGVNFLIIDFNIFFNEIYFYRTYAVFNKLYFWTIFFFNIFTVGPVSTLNFLVNLNESVARLTQILSQSLYFYNWCFFTLVWGLFLISTLLSFTSLIFLIKKQSVKNTRI